MDHSRFDALAATVGQLAAETAGVPLSERLEDGVRSGALTVEAAGVSVDVTRQLIDVPALSMVTDLLDAAGMGDAIHAAARGQAVNVTETPGPQPALHTALRGGNNAPAAIAELVQKGVQSIESTATAIRNGTVTSGEVTDVVNLGTGGSWLGPAMCVDALEGSGPCVHFLPSLDGHAVDDLLGILDPETTVVIISSKSFTTFETIANAAVLRSWLEESCGDSAMDHMFACTANPAAARDFGIADERILELWEWVGGRFSLWSAVGLPIAIHAGTDAFCELMSGARSMDDHVMSAPTMENLAWILTAVEFFNRTMLGYTIRAELPYDDSLQLLPAYLQQLEMESLGKSTGIGGSSEVSTPCAVIGQTGTQVQHTFLQALHQGTQVIPAEFIGVATPRHDHRDHHRAMARNLVGQAESLARGRSIDQTRAQLEQEGHSASEIERLLPHRTFPGNRPSTIITLQQLDARCLGAVLALFEHRVHGMATAWSINPFDQWGVELGKTVAEQLASSVEIADSATAALRRLGVE